MEAVELDDPRWHGRPGPGVGTTFAGRDVFAPVAAYLANGVTTVDVGRSIDPASLAGGALHLARPDASGVVDATVWWVDAFGNVQLNLDAADLPRSGSAVVGVGAPSAGGPPGGGAFGDGLAAGQMVPQVVPPALAGQVVPPALPGAVRGRALAAVAVAYADLGDRLGLIPDSSGLVALCLDRRSAATHLGLRAGDRVRLRLTAA